MKNFFTFFVLSLYSFSAFAQSPVVHGTVVNQSVVVAGQVVRLVDSSNGVQNYAAVDTTNANGEYSFTIPGSIATGTGIHVKTEKCGLVYTNFFVYQGTNAVSNFIVCGTTNTNNISGTVHLGTATGSPAYPATVYLIHKTLDQSTNSYILALLDTTVTNANGEFQFTGITYGAGDLLVKSALTTANLNYSNYLPTYKENMLTWNLALATSFTAGANNIHLVAGINPGGPGFIGGSVLQGANKTTNTGDPLANRLCLLTTINDVGVGYTYSDASGHFSFSNLAYGTYKLFGDAWGKANTIDTIIISANQPSVQVLFSENSVYNMPTGLNNDAAINTLNIVPNPFTNYISVTGFNETMSEIQCTLYNCFGIICLSQKTTSNSNILSTKNLSSGIYFLQLTNAQGTLLKTIRLVKE